MIGWLLISTLFRPEFPHRLRYENRLTNGEKKITTLSVPGGESWVFHWGKADWWKKRGRGSLLLGSLAGLVDMLIDVLDRGVFGDTRLGLLVGYLGSCRGEVLITLNRRQPINNKDQRKRSG